MREAGERWPAAMRRRTAAAYLDMPTTEFDTEVAAGRLPLPFRLGKAEHWTRAALDKALDVLAPVEVDDWRSRQPAYQETTPEPQAGDTEGLGRSYTPQTLATRWGISVSQVRNLCAAGELRSFRVGVAGKLLRFRPDAVADAEKRLGLAAVGEGQ